MAVKYFREVIEAVKKSNSMEAQIDKPTLSQLSNRLSLAKEMLKKAEDRWDYNSITESIKDLEFQISQAKKAKSSYQRIKNHLSSSEIDTALEKYESDFLKANKEYNKLWNELDKLKANFLKEGQTIIDRLQEIENVSSSANQLQYHIPEELSHLIKPPLRKGAVSGLNGKLDQVKVWIRKGGLL